MEQTQINIEEYYVIEYGRPPAKCRVPCHKCGGKIKVWSTEQQTGGTYRVFACVNTIEANGCDFTFTRFTPDEPYES